MARLGAALLAGVWETTKLRNAEVPLKGFPPGVAGTGYDKLTETLREPWSPPGKRPLSAES